MSAISHQVPTPPAGEETESLEGTKKQGTTARLFDEMLQLIESGIWAVGAAIPSERNLMLQFGVSRIAVREALSMLRALGVLEISHGKSTTVRKMSTETLAKLFPLLLSLEGEQSLTHVFEVRCALELQTARLAAVKRTADDLHRLSDLTERFDSYQTDTPESIEADHQFHVQIAKSTGNPLFWVLLNVLGSFVKYSQRESGKHDPEQHLKASRSHHEILQAIRERDADLASLCMERHLRDAHRIKVT
ncbi:MAG: FadR/GntR family transcriptional regulator [Planctomycetaceae bacterium]|nr:FadR family transcriptional regulator [Planctomycetaceae bacterium]